MTLYRVHYAQNGESSGYCWFTARRAAEQSLREFDRDHHTQLEDLESMRIEVVHFRPTKDDVRQLLNHYADHPDNG